MDPGSAAHHAAKSGALRSIRGTTGVRRYSKVDGWPGIGERKRRRRSDGYGRAEATPSFGRLCPTMTRERLRFARGFIRWHKYHQAKCKNSQQGRGALADFKVPREIRFVDEMPRSTLEKVAKAELRKMLG
jgi:acyl-CoA synthetase (AMP-forming)/AMP-acid ligase II